MEYVQTVLVNIAAASAGEADSLRAAIDLHRDDLRRRPGFVGMRIAPPTRTDAGDEAWLIETRWTDNNSLADYTANEPNIASIVREHADVLVPNSLQVFRMEASGAAAAGEGRVYQRLALALLVPVGVLVFGLVVIYGLSRIYLELGGDATPLAALIAIGILLVAFYFAANPTVPRWQYGAVAAVAAAGLFGGAVYALSSEDNAEHVVRPGSETPVASVSPTGSPTTPGQLALTIGDNFFELDGQKKPTVTISSGGEVTISLQNGGKAIHNMHVANSSGAFEANFCTTAGPAPCSDPARLRAGQSGTIKLNLPPGTYDFRCDFHSQEMTGTLQVN